MPPEVTVGLLPFWHPLEAKRLAKALQGSSRGRGPIKAVSLRDIPDRFCPRSKVGDGMRTRREDHFASGERTVINGSS
jgi:hypothetical protein